jgi:hypothetical protein
LVQAKGENVIVCASVSRKKERAAGKEKREKNKAMRGVPLENPFAVCFGGRNAICRGDNSFLILLESATQKAEYVIPLLRSCK